MPYTLGGETVEVAPVARHHADRRRLLARRAASAGADRAVLSAFRRLRRLRDPALGAPIPIAPGSASSWSTTLAQAGIDCEVGAWSMPMAPAAAASPCTRGCGTHDVLKVGFAAAGCARHRRRSTAARSSTRHLDGAIEAAWAIAEPLISIDKPLDIQITATNSGLDVDVRGSGPLSTRHDRGAVAARRATSAGAADPPWRTGADANAAGRFDRRGTGRAAAGLVPAGDRRPARTRWRAGRRRIASAANTSPTCSAASAPLRCGLRRNRAIAAFDSDAGAVAALQKAATSTSGLKPVKAEARDLFRRPLMPQELRDFDAVVFDPPRQGAQAQATQLAASQDCRWWSRCHATSRPSRATRRS